MKLETLSDVRLPPMSIRIMSSVLEEAGIAGAPAFRAADLSPETLPGPHETISGAQELAFQRAFLELTEDRPNLWIQVGAHHRMLSYGAYGLSIMTSPSFHKAIRTAVRDDVSYSLAHYRPIERRRVIIGLSCDLADVPADLRAFTILRDWAAMVTAFQDFWNETFPFTRIELAAPEPPSGVPSRLQISGCDVRFESGRTVYRWSPHVHRRPMMHADPVLHEYYNELWAERVPFRHDQSSLAPRIAREVREIQSLPPSLPALARQLGYSERTLQRRLREEGASFREIMSEARRLLATELLDATRLPVSEIAWRLGYSEVSSFNHAFRRWTGSSPNTFRARQHPGS